MPDEPDDATPHRPPPADRRRLLLVTELVLVGASAAVDEPQVWALYVLAFLITALWALGSPALRSLTPRLVPEEQLAAASMLNGVYGSLGAVGGPALGGVLIRRSA